MLSTSASPSAENITPGSVAISDKETFSVALKDPVISDSESDHTDNDHDDVMNGNTAHNDLKSKETNTDKDTNADKDTDTLDALIVESITMRARFMIFCVLLLCYFHCGAQSGLYLVIPYYVASTPEHGWTVSDLSIIFGVFNIGGIVAAQICMISGFAKTMKNRDRILLIGHCSQFAMGIVGAVIMSSVLGFKMWAFFVGAFLGGFSTDCTIIESYGALISDCEEVQSRLLGSIGKVFLVAGIVNSHDNPGRIEDVARQKPHDHVRSVAFRGRHHQANILDSRVPEHRCRRAVALENLNIEGLIDILNAIRILLDQGDVVAVA